MEPWFTALAFAADPAADDIDFLFGCCCCVTVPLLMVAIIWWLVALVRRGSPQQPVVLRRGRCVKCNYDLTGLPTRRCPECGQINQGGRRLYPRGEPNGFEHDERFWEGQ